MQKQFTTIIFATFLLSPTRLALSAESNAALNDINIVEIADSQAKSSTCTSSTMTLLNNYLNSFNTVQGHFSQQQDLQQPQQVGLLYLQKPGKLLWKYTKPEKYLLLIKNKEVIYHDTELQETTHMPIEKLSYSNLLTAKSIKVENDIKIISCTQNDNRVSLTVGGSSDDSHFNFQFNFSYPVIALISLTTIENGNVINNIIFKDLVYNKAIPSTIFDFKDPKFFSLPDGND